MKYTCMQNPAMLIRGMLGKTAAAEANSGI